MTAMKLLTPGPVTTRPEVRAALGADFAPWDPDFAAILEDVQNRLLRIAGATACHTALAVQGCGHFAIEAALRSFLPPGGRILVPIVGPYAARMARLAREAGRVVVELPVGPAERAPPESIAAALAADPAISHVGVVYSETGSGIIHDAAAIGQVARASGRRVILDAVSAFGALPIDLAAQPEVDALLFTANKCLEGVPGIGFAIARTDRLEASAGHAGSWSFDLADAHANAVRGGPGYARFTPPAQVIAALRVALDLFDAEGGSAPRLTRYGANRDALIDGIRAIGLVPCLQPALQGPIVVNIAAPDDPAWNLQRFVDFMKGQGFVISNFYNTDRPSFRIGCIGALDPADLSEAARAMDLALDELGVRNRDPEFNNIAGVS